MRLVFNQKDVILVECLMSKSYYLRALTYSCMLIKDQWRKVIKYIYSSIALKFNSEELFSGTCTFKSNLFTEHTEKRNQ